MYLGRNLKRLVEANGLPACMQHFKEAVSQGKINPREVSFRELAQSLIGDNWSRVLEARGSGQVHLLESGEAVDSSAFAAITGQLLINEVLEKFQSPEFIAK